MEVSGVQLVRLLSPEMARVMSPPQCGDCSRPPPARLQSSGGIPFAPDEEDDAAVFLAVASLVSYALQ